MTARRGLIACALVAVAGSAGCGGCSERPSYDQSTPDAALASLFDAARKGRLPADLDRLIGDPDEREKWQFLCEQRGCRGGTYRILEREVRGARAVLTVEFELTGDHGARTLKGARSPIELYRTGDTWMVQRVGRPVRVPMRPHDPADPARE